jgi:hypothetical protein
MAIDFPSSPTSGQAFQGYVYSSTIGAWQAKPSAQSPFYTGDTPPGNPVVGDSWFNTNDGTMYVYFNDGNTSQWVEHRSQIARNQVGLVPVRPTSVTVGSGSASVDVNNVITFSGASSLSVDGAFTSAFANYRVVGYGLTGSNATDINTRFRVGGSTNTSNVYFTGASIVRADGVNSNYTGFNGIGYGNIAPITVENGWSAFIWDIYQPSTSTTQTTSTFQSTGYSTAIQHRVGATMFNVTNVVDGFNLFPNTTSNLGGKIEIYGYN